MRRLLRRCCKAVVASRVEICEKVILGTVLAGVTSTKVVKARQ